MQNQLRCRPKDFKSFFFPKKVTAKFLEKFWMPRVFHLMPVAVQRHLDELWPGSYDFCTFLLLPVQQEDREGDNKGLHGGIFLF